MNPDNHQHHAHFSFSRALLPAFLDLCTDCKGAPLKKRVRILFQTAIRHRGHVETSRGSRRRIERDRGMGVRAGAPEARGAATRLDTSRPFAREGKIQGHQALASSRIDCKEATRKTYHHRRDAPSCNSCKLRIHATLLALQSVCLPTAAAAGAQTASAPMWGGPLWAAAEPTIEMEPTRGPGPPSGSSPLANADTAR